MSNFAAAVKYCAPKPVSPIHQPVSIQFQTYRCLCEFEISNYEMDWIQIDYLVTQGEKPARELMKIRAISRSSRVPVSVNRLRKDGAKDLDIKEFIQIYKTWSF